MGEFWWRLLETSDFPPRWECGHWTFGHGWLHILSDLGVGAAYLAIPCVLVYFTHQKKDVPFRRLFWLFSAFVLACGLTHLMEATLFWWPAYRLAGVLKMVTAVLSWTTLWTLIPVTPLALALRSPRDLEREVVERQKAEAELRDMQADLEIRVSQRTQELARTNTALQAEITARQKVDQLLQGEREWFEVTLNSIGDAVIATDTSGRVKFMNRVAREMTGYRGEVSGVSLADVFHTEHEGNHGAASDPVARVRETGAISGGDGSLLVTKDGERVAIDERAAPIKGAEGGMLGVVLVFRDISDRRRAQDALRQADRHKDQFLAMLGHELRNPLAGIAGAIQVLDVVGSAQPEAGAMRGIIRRQTAHMSRLIDDLLEVSRITRGKLQLRLERLNLGELVRSAVDDFKQALKDTHRIVQLQIAPESIWVMGDPARLAQILTNLLQNADKFSNPDGVVFVSLSVAPDGTAELSVRDQGIGIEPQALAQLFEPFRQADQTLDRSRGGLGLGLALVKGLVTLHGGQITASSAGLGCGATFAVRLPITERAALPASSPSPVPPAADRTCYRILVIDDRRDASLPLQVLLQRLGHQVEVAEDGPSGLKAARNQVPDIVLCDIGLPGGMSGYDVATALRQDRATHKAYLVAVTGYGKEEDRKSALAAGFDRHLTKPVSFETLQNLIDTVRAG